MVFTTSRLGRAAAGAAMLGVLVSACSESGGHTDPFVPTHVGAVHGRVVSANGTPLAGITVFVTPSASPGFGYASNPVTTNAKGEFTYILSRMSAPPVVAQPDTVTTQIQAARPGATSGEPGIGKAQVVVGFVPYGAIPPVANIDVVMPPIQ